MTYEVVDEVRAFQDEHQDKILLMQLMALEDGRREVRVGYYIIGKLPKMRGKWVWGQFAAFMPLPIFENLMLQATTNGWFSASSTSTRPSGTGFGLLTSNRAAVSADIDPATLLQR